MGIAFLLSYIVRIIEMTMCSNISVSANQSNVNGYFVDYPILAVIMSVIMGPFTEEIIYRGILFRFFSKYGELCAVLSTGFLFGTMHMLSSFGNTNILLFLCQWLDYFLSGILFGFIYKKIQKYLDKCFDTRHLESDCRCNYINTNIRCKTCRKSYNCYLRT